MLRKVAVSGLPLTQDDLKTLSAFISNCDHIGCLELINCRLSTLGLQAFSEGLRGSNVQIDVLDVSFNRNLRKDSLPHLHEICLRTCGLNYWQCGFKQVDLLTFAPNKEEALVAAVSEEENITRLFEHHAVLDLSKAALQNHRNILHSLLEKKKDVGLAVQITEYEAIDNLDPLYEILQLATKIRELAISESTFSAGQIESIGKCIDGEVETVNVFLSPGLSIEVWLALGEIARNHGANILLLTATGVTGPKLENLQLSLYPNQLTKLDLSRNEDLDEQCLDTLGNFVKNANIQELIMAYCRLSSSSMRTLQKSMDTAVKLKRFDISGNTALGTAGFSALGCIAENCRVEQLDISECDPNGDHLRSFETALDKAKIVKLNVSRNRNIRKKGGMEAITSIAKKSHLQELFMRQCDLDRDSLSNFRNSLGETKLPRLDLGHYFMKARPVTDDEMDVVIELLPNISEQLTLNKWELSNVQRQRLKDALDQSEKVPVIQLDRSINDVIQQTSS